MNERLFSIDEARALLPAVKARGDQLIEIRAELAEKSAAVRHGDRRHLPDVKSLEARLAELLDWFPRHGIQLKGYAPLLVDFPMQVDDRLVLLCWLENEVDLAWYHDADHGFLGRRPLSRLGDRA